MKKSLLFTMLLLSMYSFAQKKLAFGVNAGATYATFRGNYYVDDVSGSLNFLVGMTGEYKIDELFSVVANINYTRKSIKSYDQYYGSNGDGGMVIDFGNVRTVKESTIFQYITIPVMVKMNLWGTGGLYANGGGYVAQLIDVSAYVDGEKSDLNFNSAFNGSDMGVVMGIGYHIKLGGKNSLNIELRDEYGLQDIGDPKAGIFTPTKTNSANLMAIWYFK
jgi:hypothetical protein